MIDIEAETDRLVIKLADIPEVVASIAHEDPDQPKGYTEAVSYLACLVADQVTAPLGRGMVPTAQEELTTLDEWRAHLRMRCSALFAELRDDRFNDTLGLTSDDVNRNPELMVLNGIRLGLGQASHRIRNQDQAAKARAWHQISRAA